MAKIKDLCWQTDDCPNCTLKDWCDVELEMDKATNDEMTHETLMERMRIHRLNFRRA